MASSQDERSAFKLAQLQALKNTAHTGIIQKILEQEGDINYAIPAESSYNISRQSIIGNTALHFSCAAGNIKLFTSLLSHGADFTKKNKEDQTVLHMLIAKEKNIKKPLDNPFINAVLLAHVHSNNYSNPRDKDGLSHFHIACATNESATVQFFLDNNVSIDDWVSMNSKLLPGYTPLHIAVMCTNAKIVESLLAHGANMHIANASGMTPLHLLIESRIQMYDSIRYAMCRRGDSLKILQKKIQENEKIINMLLENTSIDNDCFDSIGLSNFHVACILQDTSAAQHLVDRVDLDHYVNMDSRLWPGYTALHFAAHVNIKSVEMLIKNGANIEMRDSKGLTPLDICVERYKRKDICRIISLHENWKDISFSDGKTKLVSFIHALEDQKKFEKLIHSINKINMIISLKSSLWPGYTPLHLTVLFAERTKQMFHVARGSAKTEMGLEAVKLCLENGAKISVQDSRGRTALHLAFRLDKTDVIEAMFKHHDRIPNVADDENLTHLHIACAIKKASTLKKFKLNSPLVNAAYEGASSVGFVRSGSTPLHACIADSDDTDDLKSKINVLLKNGADPHVKDACGLTPIHRLLEDCSWSGYKDAVKQLLAKVTKDDVVEEYGLSYLQVACRLDHQPAVKRLVKSGANVNLAIKYTRESEDDTLSFLREYDKCTPLHLCSFLTCEMQKLLVDHGADVFAKNADGLIPLIYNPSLFNHFVSKAWNEVALQERMQREFGWTRLHFACYLLLDEFEELVEAELTDVNARVFENSPIWKGYTPLHLLTYLGNFQAEEKAICMSKILLEKGADVTVMDDRRGTPIGMLFEKPVNEKIQEGAALLMRYHRDFNVNPVNSQGVSHFHVACFLNDMDAVRGFLEHGVDVNLPIDYFAGWCRGSTPLHLASQVEVVDLLIAHAADIRVEDVHGCDVLSAALKRDVFKENVAMKIIESGADINRSNRKGETPFEIALSKSPMTMEKLMFCLEQGCLVNSCNPITGVGYIGAILGTHYKNPNSRMHIVAKIMNQPSATTLGRITFHHIVTGEKSDIEVGDYVGLFEKLIKLDGDVDERDNEGKTALHLAVEFANRKAVLGLLSSGADMNVLNKNGKTAFSYVLSQPEFLDDDNESERRHIEDILRAHACGLAILKLDLCSINADAITGESIYNFPDVCDFFIQIYASKSVEIGVRSLRLRDFLTERGAVIEYASFSQLERCKIDEYFDSINANSSLKVIRGFLKLQYRKAVKRMKLLASVTRSFRLLLGFDLPDLCAEKIYQHLSNSDLENIIRAQIDNENAKMDVD